MVNHFFLIINSNLSPEHDLSGVMMIIKISCIHMKRFPHPAYSVKVWLTPETCVASPGNPRERQAAAPVGRRLCGQGQPPR